MSLEKIIDDKSNYVIRFLVYICLILFLIMIWINLK
jgi:hypothetical protein